MPLKSMKLSEQDKKDNSVDSVIEQPSYPYGLKIHLDEDAYEKLGLPEVPKVGSKFTMLAMVTVVDVHQSEKGDDRKYTTVGLQITDMALDKGEKEKAKDAGQVLYGSSEE